MDTTALPQTKAERVAFVNQMLAGVQPADKRPATLLQVLKPMRAELLAKRKEGFSLRQIAEGLKASKLKCDVSPATLRVLFSSPASRRRAAIKKMTAQRAANLAAAKAQPPATPTAAKA
jgi:hypothetical protein